MCGIIACKGENAGSKVLAGLKTLEYRGYDSWGIACMTEEGLVLEKEKGKIGDVSPSAITRKGTTAIGHTRWATHGCVTRANAHPHCVGNIAIVHNGIIENFESLKRRLQQQGAIFQSETDTEVIPHIMSRFMKTHDFETAFRLTLQELKGQYAVVALEKSTKKLAFGKNGSPLVLGVNGTEYFVASDVPAFISHTNKAIFLDDGDYGFIDTTLHICRDGHPVEKRIEHIAWLPEQADKGRHAHFMIKEIHEQKETIRKAGEQDVQRMQTAISVLKNAKGIFFVGCGTSYHACVAASYQFSHVAREHVNVVLASEFRNYEEFLTSQTVMVAASQSGETADVIDAIKVAKRRGVTVISIVNVRGSTVARLSDKVLFMNAGPEIGVCSTKSYTSQAAILLLLAYGLAGRLCEAKRIIQDAAAHVGPLIEHCTHKIKRIAKQMKDCHDCFLIGRDVAYASALEGALKIKEVSYVHAEGFAGGELKHGTIALITEKTPVIVLSTPETDALITSNAIEVKSRGGYIIGMGSRAYDVYDEYINISDIGQGNPLLLIIPIQLLAYHLAVERDCDPDKPRNLAKAVTVR